MSVNTKKLFLSHWAFSLATRGTVIHPEKGCSDRVLRLTKPANYKSQAEDGESQVHEHVSNPFGRNNVQTQVGHLVFLKIGMSKDRSDFENFGPGTPCSFRLYSC